MSRLRTQQDTVVVKPTMNVYTALVAVASVAVIIGIVIIYMKSQDPFFVGGLLGK
jgi:hypothetical protein